MLDFFTRLKSNKNYLGHVTHLAIVVRRIVNRLAIVTLWCGLPYTLSQAYKYIKQYHFTCCFVVSLDNVFVNYCRILILKKS